MYISLCLPFGVQKYIFFKLNPELLINKYVLY